WQEVKRVSERASTIPIGRPIANTEGYLLDGEQEPVGPGVNGELYIGGEGLAREYLRRPELTAEQFIPDPYSGREGSRLYRTGDVGRYGRDGEIEFVGRRDNQVKVRGFRAELGEVEAVLRDQAGVREAVVVMREEGEEKRLVAYIVAEGGGESGSEREVRRELRQYLQERLPEYMVPSAYVWLEELPLTPNGKVDRRALPTPGDASLSLEKAYVAPGNEIEEILAGIWSR